MIKSIIISVILIAIVFPLTLTSQVGLGAGTAVATNIVNGQEERVWRGRMLVQSAQTVRQLRESVHGIREVATEVKKVTQSAEDLYSLQQAIRDGNISVDGIMELNLANIAAFASNVSCIDLDPRNYLDVPDDSKIILGIYGNIDNCGYQSMYDNTAGSYVRDWLNRGKNMRFNPEGSYGNATYTASRKDEIEQEYNMFRTQMQNSLEMQNATEDMESKVKMQAAGRYVELAEDLTSGAIEMAEFAKDESNPIDMADRLRLINEAKLNLLLALDYKVQAVQLMSEASKVRPEHVDAYNVAVATLMNEKMLLGGW